MYSRVREPPVVVRVRIRRQGRGRSGPDGVRHPGDAAAAARAAGDAVRRNDCRTATITRRNAAARSASDGVSPGYASRRYSRKCR